MAERETVNFDVAGSNPACRAIYEADMEIVRITHDVIKIYWSMPDMWNGENLKAVNPFTYDGKYDERINNASVYFYGYKNDNQIVAVNSIYACPDNSVRSRGLYVIESYRKHGLAVKLLEHAIAESKGYDFVWSKPRVSAVEAYRKAGFQITSDIFTENSDGTPTLWPNVMARYDNNKKREN